MLVDALQPIQKVTPSYIIVLWRAIGLWICIYYIFVAHSLVVWKWHTPTMSPQSVVSLSSSMTSQQQQQQKKMSAIEMEYNIQIQKRIIKVNQTIQHGQQRMKLVQQQINDYKNYYYHDMDSDFSYSSNTIDSNISHEKIQSLFESLEYNLTKIHLLASTMNNENDENIPTTTTVSMEALRAIVSLFRTKATKTNQLFHKNHHHHHESEAAAATETLRQKQSQQQLLAAAALLELQQWIDEEQQQQQQQQSWDILQTLIEESITTDSNDSDDESDSTMPTVGQCSAGGGDSTEQNHSQQYVTKQYMENKVRYILSKVFLSQKATTTVPVSFDFTIKSIQDNIHTTVSETISDIVSSIPHEELDGMDETALMGDADHEHQIEEGQDNDANCPSSISLSFFESMILDWINVGFDAVSRRSDEVTADRKFILDIRRELLSIMMNSGVTIGLEDPFTVIGQANKKKQQNAAAALVKNPYTQQHQNNNYSNLRQLLDRPSLYKLSYHIDRLLEFLCNVNDVLDEYINQYLYNNPRIIQEQQHQSTMLYPAAMMPSTYNNNQHAGNTLLVGPILLGHFLNVIGQIYVPTNITYMKQYLSKTILRTI